MKKKFKSKLAELGFSFLRYSGQYYILSQKNDTKCKISVQLINSKPIDELKLGSRNNNEILSKGHFIFTQKMMVNEPDFFILTFPNMISHGLEFVIIPNDVIRKRLDKTILRPKKKKHKFELVLWLLPDLRLYDTTEIGLEGEWYFLNKGINGRMADDTELDYTEFLNNWDRISMG